MNYTEFINSKKHSANPCGFEPLWFPTKRPLFDFLQHITEKAIRKGRMGVFIDTGLGKTGCALTIAQNIVMKTNKRVLILTPLAVAFQFLKEAAAIGIDDIEHTKDGKHTKKIVLCNYERLHYLNKEDFICVICDESSIIKNNNARTKQHILEFIKKMPYRYLCTATPSPNNYQELGNSSEILGDMGYMDMLSRFFKSTQNDFDSNSRNIGEQFRLLAHAKNDFFAWVNTWSIIMRTPSDLGFSDERYKLPELTENHHVLKSANDTDENGQMSLVPIVAQTMTEVKNEQKNTINQRCEKAAELAQGKTSVYWCSFNDESALLKELDPDALEIIGSQPIDQKEEYLQMFSEKKVKRLITKSSITGQGLNWQHCNHTVFFPTWSYEQYYQSIRRFWRYGQEKSVVVDMVLTDSMKRVLQALDEKKEKHNELYSNLFENALRSFEHIKKQEIQRIETPRFLRGA